MQPPKWTTAIELVDPLIKSVSALQEYGVQVKTGLHDFVLQGGDQMRRITDLLHGIPLGHPLHALLTDIPIGAWTLGALFDLLSLTSPLSKRYKQTADDLTALGVIAAIPTAIAGATDYSTIKEEAADYGLLHGILNVTGLVLYILSWRARRRNQRLIGIGFGMLGMGVITASSWLGGEMVYRLRVGSNHSPAPEAPEEWQAVFPAKELEEGEAQRVEVAGQPVLLYRSGGTVSAISAVCAHAGGPLDEGKFYDGCVQCPWHDSVFDLSSGQVVHGPSVYHQPTYDVRVTNGQIRLRIPQTQEAPKS
jgi:nitrite reductase/ring-hydroxylating ferredoxin subunit/uncharacterized membrane protein